MLEELFYAAEALLGCRRILIRSPTRAVGFAHGIRDQSAQEMLGEPDLHDGEQDRSAARVLKKEIG